MTSITLLSLILLSSCGVGKVEDSRANTSTFNISIANSVEHPELRKLLLDKKIDDELFENLNKTFDLPSDIGILIEDCGSISAYYDQDDSSVVLCYELLDLLIGVYQEDDGVRIFIDYILHHELAHALIDILDLPIAGTEEDAADAIAIVLAIEINSATPADKINNAKTMILAGSLYLPLFEDRVADINIWISEHTLGLQRFSNLLCWSAGGEPKVINDEAINDEAIQVIYQEIIEANRDCIGEYTQKKDYFERFVSPHLKNNFNASLLDIPF